MKLIAPQLVKPYVKRGKNDAADAEALCEAMSRPTMRFVPVKTAEQQAALMLVGVRDRLIRNRTQLANAIRGYAAEFGVIAAKGMAHLVPLLERIEADESLPALARELFAIQAKEYVQLQAHIDEVEAKLMAWHRADECSRRLAKIPSVGPIGAVLLTNEDPGSRPIPIGTPVRGLDRFNAKGSFDRGQGQARCDYARRRRRIAQRSGGRRYLGDPTCYAQRQGVALACRTSQAQVAEVDRRSAGQQDRAHCLEDDADRRSLQRKIRAPQPVRSRDWPDTGSN